MNTHRSSARGRRPGGFTLIEVLIATALTLVLMGAVVELFRRLGTGIAEARTTLEMTDRLRSAAQVLQRDLAGATVTTLPPRRPEWAEGYLEIIEGPVGNGVGMIAPSDIAKKPDIDNPGNFVPDTSVADFDDIIMLTVRRPDQPFVGRCTLSDGSTSTIRSDVAEVAWFLRGRTLYRRVLLVAPGAPVPLDGAMGFYANNDISVRLVKDPTNPQYPNVPPTILLANSLGDLTKRENRFAHDPSGFPYDVRHWGFLRLPTVRECSSNKSNKWTAAGMTPITVNPTSEYDFWRRGSFPWRCKDTNGKDVTDPETGTLTAYMDGLRVADDVILPNVIGFDVKVWEPGVNMYVDLGYEGSDYNPSYSPAKCFYHLGYDKDNKSGLTANANNPARVYDTWSTHYETEGVVRAGSNPPDPRTGRGANGLDDDNDGIVDEPDEAITAPPYPAPLRGIQVKIRTFDPDSQQIREVTVVQDFLPK